MLSTIFTIDSTENNLLEQWAARLEATGLWSSRALEELHRAELRLGVRLAEFSEPIAFATVGSSGGDDAEGYGEGELWFDHLYVDERARGRNLMLPLYERQMSYAAKHPGRRIFRLPVSERVVHFSLKRGWQHHADVPEMPFGVYELPRAFAA